MSTLRAVGGMHCTHPSLLKLTIRVLNIYFARPITFNRWLGDALYESEVKHWGSVFDTESAATGWSPTFAVLRHHSPLDLLRADAGLASTPTHTHPRRFALLGLLELDR